MRYIGLFIVILCGALLLYATQDFPAWGDPNSPASSHVSPHYIQKSIEETSVPNLVTSVLADYRSFDTMFETTVIFCAGLACLLLLRTFIQERGNWYYRHIPTEVTLHIKDARRIPKDIKDFERIDTLWVPYDLIIKTVCRICIPFIQLFAMYVVAHGDFSPGGGFQCGVIFGASLILLAIAFDLRTAIERLDEFKLGVLSALGVFLYAGIGMLCMILGGSFLDYSQLSKIFPVDPVHIRALGMLGVEIGVGISVMAVMAIIYINIASEGRQDEGL